MSSPTQRTLAECRNREWLACVVEKWIPQAGRRVDVFGFGDILAVDGLPGSLLIQATTTENMSARVKKIQTECHDAAKEWLRYGNRIGVWGWAKRGPADKRKVWTLRIINLTLSPEGEIV
jgi:hypothetical protein